MPSEENYGMLCFATLAESMTRKQSNTFEQMVEELDALIVGEPSNKSQAFFIPDNNQHKIDSIKDFIKTKNSTFRCVPMLKNEDTRQFIASIAIEEFKLEFDELHKETNNLSAFAQRPVKFKNHLKRFQNLKRQATYYSNMLGMNGENFVTKLNKEIAIIQRGILATS